MIESISGQILSILAVFCPYREDYRYIFFIFFPTNRNFYLNELIELNGFDVEKLNSVRIQLYEIRILGQWICSFIAVSNKTRVADAVVVDRAAVCVEGARLDQGACLVDGDSERKQQEKQYQLHYLFYPTKMYADVKQLEINPSKLDFQHSSNFREFQSKIFENILHGLINANFDILHTYQKQIMQRGKHKQVSLPHIQENYIQIAKVSVYQAKPENDSGLRFKTQPFISKHKESSLFGSQLFQNIGQVQQIQHNAINQDFRKYKLEKGNKGENVFQLIDTRKSIKILLDYFDSKSQQQKSKNMNCYHSPRKQVSQLLPTINAPGRSIVGRKIINLKKIKLEQKKIQTKTQGNQTPVRPKKYRSHHMKDVIKIQNLQIESYQKQCKNNFSAKRKVEEGKRQKINSCSDTKQAHSVMKIKSRDSLLHVQRKVPELQGWHINNDTNYLQ